MWEGSVMPGHLCVRPGGESGWHVLRIGEDGTLSVLWTLQRFDLAERRAETIAESLARNDHGRILAGRECSGTRAIVMDHDVWVIDHDSDRPHVLAVPMRIPRQRTLSVALDMLG
jgi:hypothetical protein